ncbi:hypothetical protein QAD02_017518 [Eretmocerus hayati]|uniref:Uncharacterized protein n=1 Tax=Eretmocerus hayati TaxID=131215 RepID=A0ACC2PE35_9HYME|nr:hypothetical protein QAD02_017518 [Eretmocerus hayati]
MKVVLIILSVYSAFLAFATEALFSNIYTLTSSAGSAGCVLASRLTENQDVSVLLIEAGGPENLILSIPLVAPIPEFNPDWNYDYRTEPYPDYCRGHVNKRCVWPVGKGTGGTSAVNLLIAHRGNMKDYDEWAKITGDDSWTPSTKNFVQAGAELGFPTPDDYNGPNQTGFHYLQYTMKNGERWSVNRAYLHPAKDRRNLYITRHSHVSKILIDLKTKSAYGVQFEKNHKTVEVLARKEVILSAGAIVSPKLLMLSGVGPAGYLSEFNIPTIQDSPGVGSNLLDHPLYEGIVFTIPQGSGIVTSRIINPLNPHIKNYLNNRNGQLSQPSHSGIAWVNVDNPNSQDDDPNMELIFSPTNIVMDNIVYKVLKIDQNYWKAFFGKLYERDAFQILPVLIKPKSTGRVLLKSQNSNDKLRLIVNYFQDPEEVHRLIKGIRLAIAVGKTRAMREAGAEFFNYPVPSCRDFKADSDEYWECAIRTLTLTNNHHSGSCCMGKTDDVNGIKNLRVVDASVTPTSSSGHIHLTIIAIAEKISDVIKEDWGMIRPNYYAL